ncbi:MAG: cell wall hydrolase [Lachnospiraceae bacterium]|nr:cell wall hydrolase [Lachnospiraceae bacterium]
MNRTYLKFALLGNLLFLLALFNCRCIALNRVAATEAFRLEYQSSLKQEKNDSGRKYLPFLHMMRQASSGQRVVDYDVLEQSFEGLTMEDYQILLRIVEAEAGSEDMTGKMLVANVVMNRVADESFPDTVKEVVFQKANGVTQFSPVSDGRYEEVKISEETVEAVERVLSGEDHSEGALYFVSRKYADPDRLKWFDQNLTPLFTYGGHQFFL